MNYFRPLLSTASIVAAYLWSRLVLPFGKEQIPFSGWSDGASGSAATFHGPVLLFWLATMFALCFICIKPYFPRESRFTRSGRWLTNLALVPVGPILVLYAMHGPPVKFLALYGFVALAALWLYVDLAGAKSKGIDKI